jgi:hypothetical protein
MSNKKSVMGVFLALTFADKIYENYIDVNSSIQQLTFQNLIITLRQDGYFGFLGGYANFDEDELSALARECKEEGNIDISKLNNLSRICEHVLRKDFKVILYHAQITKQEAKEIIRNSVDAEHFFTEVSGLNSIALIPTSSFAKNNFKTSVKEEFTAIAEIIQSDILKNWGSL